MVELKVSIISRQITAAVAADASPEAIAAATQEALRVGVSGEVSELSAGSWSNYTG